MEKIKKVFLVFKHGFYLTRNFLFKGYLKLKYGVKEVIDEHTDYLPYPEGVKGVDFGFYSIKHIKTLIIPSIKEYYQVKKYYQFKPGIFHSSVWSWNEIMELERKKKEEEEEEERKKMENLNHVKTNQTNNQENVIFEQTQKIFSNSIPKDFNFNNFLKERIELSRKGLRQFIIGYNEGMGREIPEEKLNKDFKVSDLEWQEIIRKVAQKSRDFTEDLKKTIDVKDEDLKK